MVTINATLILQLLLFLGFLWMMNTFIFRPLFRVMDKREAKVADDLASTEQLTATAEELEREYAANVAAIHRDASHEIVSAHREAQKAHNVKVKELKKREVEELEEVRQEAFAQVEAARAVYPKVCADLEETMAEHLGLGREAS